jgi:hypothetical protein
MVKNFSYPIPDEIYVNSFIDGKEIFLAYDGPDSIDILVDKNTNAISGINPETYDQNIYDLVTVYAEKNPEICYYILNPPSNEYEYEYEYEDEIMENGDIYKKIINPQIQDLYEVVYDRETNSFRLDLIVKVIDNNFITSGLMSIKNRLNFILSNEKGKLEKQENLDISEELFSQIPEIIEDIENYINQNNIFMDWKYTNFDNILDILFPISEEIKELLATYQ